jgi:hypothetical protein
MADDKRGREKQAQDAERRQRERDVAAELERGEEPRPPVDESALDWLESALDPVSFPATGSAVVDQIGDREVESTAETYTVEELVPETETVAFDSPAAVRARVLRPTVAASMKRIVEAGAALPDRDRFGSQREAYERTLRALVAVDPDDEDEVVETVTDWIVERIEEKEALPGSRAVRRQAAKVCRANGHQVRDDEWLGA